MKGLVTSVLVFLACGIAGCATPFPLPVHDVPGQVDAEKVKEAEYCAEFPWSTACVAKKVHAV